MITDGTGKLIALLLAGILAVLLFGRDNVLVSGYVILAIGAAIGVLFVIFWVVKAAVKPLVDDYKLETDRPDVSSRQRILLIIGYIALAGNVVAVSWAVIYGLQSNSIRDAFEATPLVWIPGLIFIACFGLYSLDKRVVGWIRRRKPNEPY